MCAVSIEENMTDDTGKKFRCKTCPYQSHERSNAKRHERTVHDKIKNFVCGECGRAFKLKHQLKNHFAMLHFKHGKLKETLYGSSNQSRVATIPEKMTPTPAKCGSELTPVTPTPLKSRNLPYIIELNPELDSDSFWEKSRLQATPGIVATLLTTSTVFGLLISPV